MSEQINETQVVATETPVVKAKRGRKPKYSTDEERKEAWRQKHVIANRKWLQKPEAKEYFKRYFKEHPEKFVKKPKPTPVDTGASSQGP